MKRDVMEEAIRREMGGRLAWRTPKGGFFLWATLPAGVTDEDYVLALLRETGVLTVFGSGFGTRPEDGFFRIGPQIATGEEQSSEERSPGPKGHGLRVRQRPSTPPPAAV